MTNTHLTHDEACYPPECDAVQPEPACRESEDGSHDWTSKGCGGIKENPGVWSLGGTTFAFTNRCRLCGAGRHVVRHGPQRNPGECDAVEYRADEFDVDEA